MKLINTLFFLISCLFSFCAISAENTMNADVVVLVDTSTSMKETGMDPNRASLLVSKLLSDVVPGNLVFLRLLDANLDADLLPSVNTGRKVACWEDKSKICYELKADTNDWLKKAYKGHYGALARPAIKDSQFKQQLDAHLYPKTENSTFYLAFAAADGVFDTHEKVSGVLSKHLIWLSDGKVKNAPLVKQQIGALTSKGVKIDAIIFGQGDTSLAKNTGISYVQSHGPADLMKIFADIFRKIVKAPYDIDNRIAVAPKFKMLSNILNSWVVVYGDDSLGAVTITAPTGDIFHADYAQDKQVGAGAYRVALISTPESGVWKINVQNGGSEVAYAVIQNSSLYPALEEPVSVTTGANTLLVSSIKSGIDNQLVNSAELIQGSDLTAKIDGTTYQLTDDGLDGDVTANDGLYSGYVYFLNEGSNAVELRLKNPQVDKTKTYWVNAMGFFKYTEGSIDINFGTLGLDKQVCRQVVIKAEHKGRVHFNYEVTDSLPAEHTLSMASSQATKNNNELVLSPAEAVNICLKTGKTAPSSTINKQPLLLLKVLGSNAKEQRVIFNLSWQVNGLSFWERWAWLFYWIIGILALILIILGFVLPQRFRSSLHIAMGQDIEELNEYSPMQLKRWPGVRIGFYRSAKAYVYDDFRVQGKQRGASVEITAGKQVVNIAPINGRILYRKNFQQEWEQLEGGVALRTGEVLRIDTDGLYFKLLDQ